MDEDDTNRNDLLRKLDELDKEIYLIKRLYESNRECGGLIAKVVGLARLREDKNCAAVAAAYLTFTDNGYERSKALERVEMIYKRFYGWGLLLTSKAEKDRLLDEITRSKKLIEEKDTYGIIYFGNLLNDGVSTRGSIKKLKEEGYLKDEI